MKPPIKFDTEQHAPAIVAIPAIPAIPEAENSRIAAIASQGVLRKPDQEAENSTLAGIAEDSLSQVRAWLHSIGENSHPIIEDVLRYCHTHPEGLAYYLQRAEEAHSDDRHYCRECQQIRNGFCTDQRFNPVDNLPRRCIDFLE